jgi:pyruvate dehydrogenase E2 component (dihydrolipoamide acetyltransferase)
VQRRLGPVADASLLLLSGSQYAAPDELIMSERKIFLLPDLGEGLPDAEIVEWKVAEGDSIQLDEPLVAMETAKAVVDVPSPFSGRIVRLHGKAGDVIETGKALAEFELSDGPQRAAAQDTGHHGHAQESATPSPKQAAPTEASRTDSGTVVGAMVSSDRLVAEAAIVIGGVRALPAVRALARKLGVDLQKVRGSGPEGSISNDDVRLAHQQSQTATAAPVRPTSPTPAAAAPAPAASAAPPPRTGRSGDTTVEELRGVRRNMARTMSAAHAEVVPTTLMDDADIHNWAPAQDLTVRLVRALVVASRVEPGLNAWFDGKAGTRTLHQRVDVGIAVDTDDGLFVPALRNADVLDAAAMRTALNRLRDQVKQRSIPAADLSGYTLMLSNFGVYAGRYATPMVVPPCVCIVGAGKVRFEAIPVMGGIAAHRIIPLSLTFDHRACTGGEAARFLRAMLDDLARSH